MNIIELYNINNNIDVRTNLISLKDKLSKDLSLTELKQDINYNTEIFAKLLLDEDSKVRKNTALIIGMIDEPGLVKNLYESYEKENTLFVRSAYLRSLRKYDFSAYKDSLTERLNNLKKAEYEQSELKHIAEELQELKTMVGIKGEREAVSFRNPKEPVLIFLTCKKEMADILAEQVKEMTDLVTKKVFCGVALKTADIGKVSCIRTYKELLFPLNGLTAYDGADVIREIIKGDLFKLLDSLHDKKDAVYNFRVSGNIDAMKFGREIETASYGRLVNSVSDYDIELRFIQNKESKSACLLKLFTKKDNRFAYRKNHVATSLTPVNAAGIVKMSEKYLEKYAQVLDPFCGVGTLLIERNKLVRTRTMYGIDIFGEAIEGGRQNGADVIREIIKGDLFKLLDSLHDKKDAVYNFRVSGNIDAMKFGREIETASYGRLVNSVSDYDIELRFIQNKESKSACLLKLFTKKDNRFAYRKNHVATSLTPVNAAGIVKMSEKYLEKYAQVLDPFCGVGTLLIERNKLVRTRTMYGIDIFGEAIEGGRQNAVLAGVGINYICRNFFDFRHEYLFDEIITEMLRFDKGQADDFYRRFFDKAVEVLKEEGVIILVSEEMGIIKKYLRLNKKFRLINELPFNSKENINIYIIMKKRSE